MKKKEGTKYTSAHFISDNKLLAQVQIQVLESAFFCHLLKIFFCVVRSQWPHFECNNNAPISKFGSIIKPKPIPEKLSNNDTNPNRWACIMYCKFVVLQPVSYLYILELVIILGIKLALWIQRKYW